MQILDELQPSLPEEAVAGPSSTGDMASAEGREAAKEDDAAPDFASLLAAEVGDLKDKSKQRFRFHDTGIRTLLFLEMPFATADVGPCQVRPPLSQVSTLCFRIPGYCSTDH